LRLGVAGAVGQPLDLFVVETEAVVEDEIGFAGLSASSVVGS